MLHAESKDKNGVLMKVEGNPLQIMTVLLALAVCVSEETKDPEKFIDEIPFMVRAYGRP